MAFETNSLLKASQTLARCVKMTPLNSLGEMYFSKIHDQPEKSISLLAEKLRNMTSGA